MSATIRVLDIEKDFQAPGNHLCGIAWDGRLLWHSDGDTNRIYRINQDTGAVVADIPCENVRTDLSFDGLFLWQIAGHPKRVVILEPAQGRVIREIDLGPERENACGLCVEGERYWVGFKRTGYVEERSHDNKVQRTFKATPRISGLTIATSTLWYTDYEQSLLVGIGLKSQEETGRYSVIGNPNGLAWDGSLFWYGDFTGKRICAVRL